MTNGDDNTLDVFDDRARRVLEDTECKQFVKIYEAEYIHYLLNRSYDKYRGNPRRNLFPKGDNDA